MPTEDTRKVEEPGVQFFSPAPDEVTTAPHSPSSICYYQGFLDVMEIRAILDEPKDTANHQHPNGAPPPNGPRRGRIRCEDSEWEEG
ncbi:unnamed protein product [Nezara viridula]|uniref:Uncharacterized protein n=1 Tax=Nezara viridula TaxID=85310 RepID=A0A9P0H4T1_NEZVI|nr:unnamed protein product [Nezara viridula]